MTWNYRVIRTVYDGEVSLDIHEVFYDKDGKPNGWSKDPMPVYAETKEELLRTLAWMTVGVCKPFLEEQGDNLVEIPDES